MIATKKKEKEDGSLIYFGDVSNYNKNKYKEKYDKLTEDRLFNDFNNQTFLLAVGLRNKFSYLKWATWFIGLEFLTLIIIGINILK